MTDNRTTELLPCPFCGGEAELKRYQSGDWQVICYHADGCIMCESDLDNCYWENVQTLAKQWNTRAELGRLNATSSQESIVRSFLRKISPNRDWDYLGEHEHAMIADLVDDIAATLGAGECEMKLVCTSYHGFDVYRCSSCGTDVAELTYMGKSDKPNFCKSCGKAVKR